jgi:hypothetical protein
MAAAGEACTLRLRAAADNTRECDAEHLALRSLRRRCLCDCRHSAHQPVALLLLRGARIRRRRAGCVRR